MNNSSRLLDIIDMNNEICDNILATIGDTPMVRINRLPHRPE